MSQTKVSIVPVVVGALGIVKQGQADIVKCLPGNCSIVEIQKNVLLGCMAIFREVLNIDNQHHYNNVHTLYALDIILVYIV